MTSFGRTILLRLDRMFLYSIEEIQIVIPRQIFFHKIASMCVPAWIVCTFWLGLSATKPSAALSSLKDDGDLTLFQKALVESNGSVIDTELTAAKFLSIVAKGEADESEFVKWIADLGSESYRIRENAESRLYSIPILPEKYRDLARNGSDPEIQFRLTAIFKNRQNRVDKLLIAAIKTAANAKLDSTLDDLLFLYESTTDVIVARELRSAILSVTRLEQQNKMINLVHSERKEMRLLGANVLCKLNVSELSEKLSPLLNDREDSVRFDVARWLIEREYKVALKTFCELITSPSTSIGFRSERVLSAVTGEDFGRVSFSMPKQNSQLQAKWLSWCDGNADSIRLRLPLKAIGKMNGHTLIAINQNLVIELNAEQKEVNRISVDKVLGAEMTIDGNYLLFSYQLQWVREVTRKGEIVWQINGPKFNNAMALLNGNVLVTIGTENLVREIDPRTKKTVWECKVDWWANDAFRLENGNTLVGGKGGVVEIAPDKTVVWSYKNESPNTIVVAKPAGTAGFLIGWTDGRVKVLTRDKTSVWEYKSDSKLSDVFRDDEGSTFVVADKEILQLDVEKKIVWRYPKKTGTGTIRR